MCVFICTRRLPGACTIVISYLQQFALSFNRLKKVRPVFRGKYVPVSNTVDDSMPCYGQGRSNFEGTVVLVYTYGRKGKSARRGTH